MNEVKEWMKTTAAHIREVMRHPSPDRAEDLRRETRIVEIIAAHAPAEAVPDSAGSPQKPECSCCGKVIATSEPYQVYFGAGGVRLTCHSEHCPQYATPDPVGQGKEKA
jgi:hypothetical protein